jgi:hypothetical protein
LVVVVVVVVLVVLVVRVVVAVAAYQNPFGMVSFMTWKQPGR